MYSQITEAVLSEFHLAVAGEKIAGLDVVFQDFTRGSDMVSLEWDNWSGYIVRAKSASAEPLVLEIANYITTKFNS
jgi:hypothetical protein